MNNSRQCSRLWSRLVCIEILMFFVCTASAAFGKEANRLHPIWFSMFCTLIGLQWFILCIVYAKQIMPTINSLPTPYESYQCTKFSMNPIQCSMHNAQCSTCPYTFNIYCMFYCTSTTSFD